MCVRRSLSYTQSYSQNDRADALDRGARLGVRGEIPAEVQSPSYSQSCSQIDRAYRLDGRVGVRVRRGGW